MNANSSALDIAIVGMAALFPGARDLDSYWRNILAGTCYIQDAPPAWTGPYLDANERVLERIYTQKVGLLGDLAQFNPLEFGIPPHAVDGGDPDHFLALKLARDALQDAGYLERPFAHDRAGVILGRGVNPNRGSVTALQHSLVVDQTVGILQQLLPSLPDDTVADLRRGLKKSLPDLPSEAAPGLMSHMVSARIANRLNLLGPNYTVDAACASSLIAVELACQELVQGRSDLMLAGGVQVPMPAQVYMLFCYLGALSPTGIRPFDRAANGTTLSEGAGMVVLKRLRDAQADGDRIYAVLKGIGTASDGRALGLLAPRFEGQVLALEKAYAQAEVDPASIGLIEAHGTGIPIGDQTEIRTLQAVYGASRFPCAIGSVKSMIGHCIPASGTASLIKTALALYHKILPPSLCEQVNSDLGLTGSPFYLNTQTRPWVHGRPTPRRAGVNAFGFGGINVHAILEESPAPVPTLHPPAELLLLSADTRSALVRLVHQLQAVLTQNSQSDLGTLAQTLAKAARGGYRLALVVADQTQALARLQQADQYLRGQQPLLAAGSYYGEPSDQVSGLVFLFPGHETAYPNMGLGLTLHFPQIRAWFDRMDAEDGDLPSTYIFPRPTGLTPLETGKLAVQLKTPALGFLTTATLSLALAELLADCGVRPTVLVGHGSGEQTALLASQSATAAQVQARTRVYRQLAGPSSLRGTQLEIGVAPAQFLTKIVQETPDLYLMADDGPERVVLFGEDEAATQAMSQLRAQWCLVTRTTDALPLNTPLLEPMVEQFAALYQDWELPVTTIYSCVTAQPFPAQPQAFRALAAQGVARPIQFRQTLENLYAQGMRTFVEVGPGRTLTDRVGTLLKGRDHLALAVDQSYTGWLDCLGQLFSRGTDLDLTPLAHSTPPTPQPVAGTRTLNLALPLLHLGPVALERLKQEI
ncbi:type I polyketide synthase [Candidatus Cyanaurora vandensis]|uniref:type I polyketide synthase n=1 Tax=Candidatus Cyanaurora vandensis TaxID=2714958 RepID=UPI00257FA4E1|nr:type I polyketide synthase [Candidatus Cyanaurora vandensis]